jgi:hypothetical protein
VVDKKIAFESTRNSSSEIDTMNALDGSEQQNRTNNAERSRNRR